MARVTLTKSSRKPHVCGRGGHDIPAGDGYYSASPGFRGRTLYRCLAHPFRESELTTSMRAEPLAAREDLEDTLDTLEVGDYDGLTDAVETFASAVREYADARQEALDAWEYGNAQLEEFAETAETAADEAEAITGDIYPFDDEEPDRSDYADDIDGAAEYDAAHDEWETARDEAWETAIDDVRSAIGGIEF